METVTEIKITCQGATTIPLDELVDLQGNLKDLSEDNYVKLRNSIVKYGFSFPIFVWIDPQDEKKYIVDAHQRLRVLKKMRDEENISIPPLPADIIAADNRTQAKEKLLLLNSHYGKMTREGYDEFIAEVGFEINDDLDDLLELPEIQLWDGKENEQGEDTPHGNKEKKKVTCPNCSHEFEV